MDPQALILLLSFVALLALGVPIAFSIGIATFCAIYSVGTLPSTDIVAQRMAGGIESFPLLAIPFFVLAGEMMGAGGMARRLIDFASAVVGPIRGGLSYVTTITCMLFGAISGSAAAAVSSIGGVMIPEMQRKGYGKDFAIALTTTSATTGLVIPPSNVMIVYAVVAQNVSIAALFLAGVVPGIVTGLIIMAMCFIVGGKKMEAGERWQTFAAIGKAGLQALPSLMLVVIVLGGIFGGVFSATEASAVAVAYALLLGMVIYREIGITRLPAILLKSAKTTAIVFLLIATSQAMSWLLAYEQIPQQISEAMLAATDNKILLLLAINFTLLAVGTFMDCTPAVLIFTPVFLPVVTGPAIGMDPTHFGILLIVNLCIGLCTPPVGTCLFIGCSVGKSTIPAVSRAMLPFLFAMLVALMLITYVPQLSLWLPQATGFLK